MTSKTLIVHVSMTLVYTWRTLIVQIPMTLIYCSPFQTVPWEWVTEAELFVSQKGQRKALAVTCTGWQTSSTFKSSHLKVSKSLLLLWPEQGWGQLGGLQKAQVSCAHPHPPPPSPSDPHPHHPYCPHPYSLPSTPPPTAGLRETLGPWGLPPRSQSS